MQVCAHSYNRYGKLQLAICAYSNFPSLPTHSHPDTHPHTFTRISLRHLLTHTRISLRHLLAHTRISLRHLPTHTRICLPNTLTHNTRTSPALIHTQHTYLYTQPYTHTHIHTPLSNTHSHTTHIPPQHSTTHTHTTHTSPSLIHTRAHTYPTFHYTHLHTFTHRPRIDSVWACMLICAGYRNFHLDDCWAGGRNATGCVCHTS